MLITTPSSAMVGMADRAHPSVSLPGLPHHLHFQAPHSPDNAGYAKFRNWSLYGERALTGEVAQVNIFQDFLTLE